jgi:uncharacterized protein (DUF1684 family)
MDRFQRYQGSQMTEIVRRNLPALAHWRRATAEMYALVRQCEDPLLAWQQLVNKRNHLFKNDAQSPLDLRQRTSFQHLSYYPYESAFRVIGYLDYAIEEAELLIDLADDDPLHLRRVAAIFFELPGQTARLSLFWVQGYGGGLFLPFKDQSNLTETYGGGRYLYDTIKGADLGANEDEIVLDFNFAYNPSCAYDARWVCPLAPQENSLNMAITAGEKRFIDGYGE